jgi:Mg2+ and Co2+ transporter CorA
MDEPIVEEFYDHIDQPDHDYSLYIPTHFQEHIEGLDANHRWRIEKLRTIIRTHRIFDDTESFGELRDYIANCNEQINSIRTALNEKEQRINRVVQRLEQCVNVKVYIRKDFRRDPEGRSRYDKEFNDIDQIIEMLNELYQLLSRQLESLARFSLKAIDVLQEHKTAARSFLTVLLLKKSRSITKSLYTTVNPRGEFEDFNDEEYREARLNAGMNEYSDEDEDDD